MDRAVSRSRSPRLDVYQVPLFQWEVWYESGMWRKLYWSQWEWADYQSHTDPATDWRGFVSWDFIVLAWEYLDYDTLALATRWIDFSEWELEKQMSSLSVRAQHNDEFMCVD